MVVKNGPDFCTLAVQQSKDSAFPPAAPDLIFTFCALENARTDWTVEKLGPLQVSLPLRLKELDTRLAGTRAIGGFNPQYFIVVVLTERAGDKPDLRQLSEKAIREAAGGTDDPVSDVHAASVTFLGLPGAEVSATVHSDLGLRRMTVQTSADDRYIYQVLVSVKKGDRELEEDAARIFAESRLASP